VFSDSLGNYEFRSLPAGIYDVIVDFEGYEEARQTAAVAGGGLLGTTIVNIPLKQKVTLVRIPASPGGDGSHTVDIRELGRKHPRKAVQDFERAVEETKKGNPGKAVELLAGVVKLAPDFYSAYNLLGTLHQKAGRLREAESAYRRAMELNPRSAEPVINLGSLLIQEAAARSAEDAAIVGKILDDALDILDEAVKLSPRSAMAYYLLGTAYYRSAFYEEAERNLKRAFELDPNMPSLLLMLANLYIRQQQWANALKYLDAYLLENPKASDRSQIEQTRAKVRERMR
jgi:Flp pilus assembly protein TadD